MLWIRSLVCQSVGLPVMRLRCAKMAKRIKVLFEMDTRANTRNKKHASDGGQWSTITKHQLTAAVLITTVQWTVPEAITAIYGGIAVVLRQTRVLLTRQALTCSTAQHTRRCCRQANDISVWLGLPTCIHDCKVKNHGRDFQNFLRFS